MKIFTLICILFMTLQSKAQLPSEKSLDEMLSPAAKQKLQYKKQRSFSQAELPSNAPLPKQALARPRTSSTSSQGGETRRPRTLPSEVSDDELLTYSARHKRNK